MYDVFSAAWRKRIYAALAVVGIVIGAIQVAYLTGATQPRWLDIALAVFAFLGGTVHSMARTNTAKKKSDDVSALGYAVPPSGTTMMALPPTSTSEVAATPPPETTPKA